MKERVAMYPGTFDPITNGHLDIMHRAAKIFDILHVVLMINPVKKTLFSLDERLEMIRNSVAGTENIVVTHFAGLSVEYCNSVGAAAIVRGLRAQMDFEYEFQIAGANQFLNPDIEMCFLMTRQNLAFVSSSVVKEIAHFRGRLDGLVPEAVEEALRIKYL